VLTSLWQLFKNMSLLCCRAQVQGSCADKFVAVVQEHVSFVLQDSDARLLC
jgi:hypothetical protein